MRNYEVKAVNTAIGSFLRKDINVQNENFQNLHDYILYLQTNVTGSRVLEGTKKVVNDSNGTGYAAHRDDILLAGKTGTAEIKASK